MQELPNVSLVELQNMEPSQNWRDSDAANRVNEIRQELQEECHREEVGNSNFF